ncbi:MAG: hypothetical protein QOE96_388 [Blastocatellia bacterium]|jgi:hypothetical protein|nr:hypothetical protein [Blastocatellia bacterium]
MMTIRTDRLPDATTLGQKRIFVVDASRPVTEGEKTIRRIVIFDNHPASLRLLLSSDLKLRRRSKVFYAVLAIALVLAAGVGMLWPLL